MVCLSVVSRRSKLASGPTEFSAVGTSLGRFSISLTLASTWDNLGQSRGLGFGYSKPHARLYMGVKSWDIEKITSDIIVASYSEQITSDIEKITLCPRLSVFPCDLTCLFVCLQV